MDDSKFARAQLIAAYKRLFLKTPCGRDVLADLAAEGGFDRPSVDRDAYMTYFNEGRRSIVLEIFEKLNVDVRTFLTENVVTEDI